MRALRWTLLDMQDLFQSQTGCAITRFPPATGQKEGRGVNLLTMLGQLDQDRLVKGTRSEQEQ